LLSPIFNHGSGPQDILDFGYLRKQNGEWGDLEVSGIIAYQQVGFVAVLGFGTLMLEELKGSINTLFLLLALLMCIIASFYAGARQFIVISILLVVLWTLFEKRGSASKVLVPIFSVILVYFLYNILFSSEGMLYSVQTDGYLRASDRDGLVEQGLNDFHKSPFVGIGYGCFDFFGTIGGYPHNLFVEILAELGILGLLLFWIPLCKPLFTILFKIRPCLYLMIIYFFRSMASGGLDTNIYLYSFILASYCVFASQPLEKQNNNN
jgi:O-antigen ligase